MSLHDTYRQSLALLTDLYQLTMAYGYWKLGRTDRRATFHLFFRRAPFDGGYTIAAGLAYVMEYIESFRFDASDLEYLATMRGNDGAPLFDAGFLDYLRNLRLEVDVTAVPEGTVVFPHQPLVRVQGSLLQCQLLETPLLNMINFQTLIATKAARICQATRGEPVLEFGLRRAHGVDGALAASRAAYIGGCAATSNVLAGKLYGIPVRGTHAHSWVMSFGDEQSSFDAYAEAMPNNCVFLVDTYDTLQGVRNAIRAGEKLRDRGHKMIGIRLDSGDLAFLSIEARKLLDRAGFEDAAIIASNDLDEYIIDSLKNEGAKIAVWGVGTRLVTSYEEPALGGVYKLTAIQSRDGEWGDKVKLSDQAAKSTTPGILQIRRFRDDHGAIADMIYDERRAITLPATVVDPVDFTRRKVIPVETPGDDLLVEVIRGGKIVYDQPTLEQSRARTNSQLDEFHPGIRRFLNPHRYPAGIELSLHDHRTRLTLEARGLLTYE